jgi:hypothetical protein
MGEKWVGNNPMRGQSTEIGGNQASQHLFKWLMLAAAR